VFFSKGKNLVGLDIGSSAVKVVELKELGKNRGYQLLNVALERLSPEAIVDGAIMDAGTRRGHRAARLLRPQDQGGGCGDSALRPQRHHQEDFDSGDVGGGARRGHPWEAEQYIPFDVQDVNLAYQVLKGASGGEGNMDVLLVAAKKDKINDYTSVVSQAGRNPLVVDVDVFALQNCYEMNYDTDPGVARALVNIGASTTNVAILKARPRSSGATSRSAATITTMPSARSSTSPSSRRNRSSAVRRSTGSRSRT